MHSLLIFQNGTKKKNRRSIHVSILNGCSVNTMSWWSEFGRFVSIRMRTRVLLNKTINGHAIVCYVSCFHAYHSHRDVQWTQYDIGGTAIGMTAAMRLTTSTTDCSRQTHRRHFSGCWMIDSRPQINWIHLVIELYSFSQHCQTHHEKKCSSTLSTI